MLRIDMLTSHTSALQAASRKRARTARESLVAEQPGSFQERYRFEGRRIVYMQEFAKNLECHLCKRRLDIVNTVYLYKFVSIKKNAILIERRLRRENERVLEFCFRHKCNMYCLYYIFYYEFLC